MNIAIFEGKACNNWGGAEKSMFSFINYMKANNHNIFLFFEKDGNWIDKNNVHIFKDTKKLNINSPTGQGLLAFIRNLISAIRFIKNSNIDLLLTHTIHGFFFLRIISHLTNTPIAVYFKWIYNQPSIGVLNKWGAKKIDYAAASTNYVKAYWQKNGVLPTKKFAIIPNGIKESKQQIMNNPYSNRDIRDIVFLGRIYEGKGLDILVEALKSFPNLNLKIVGKFETDIKHDYIDYHKKIKEIVSSNPISKQQVTFLGESSNPLEEICKADLVIVPSVWPEAQSRVVIEAMATKTIVIASKIGGIPEVLGDAGKYLLFEPNQNSLEKRINFILRLTNERIEKITNELYIRFKQKYTEQATHDALNNYFELNIKKYGSS